MSKLISQIKRFDSFGTKAEFTYKQNVEGNEVATTVKTKFGACITLIYASMFLITVYIKTIELVAGHGDAQHQVTTAFLDDSTPIDLVELGYMFALSAIDPKLGRYKAKQWINNESTDIPMVDCKSLLPDPNDITEGHIGNSSFNPYHSEA